MLIHKFKRLVWAFTNKESCGFVVYSFEEMKKKDCKSHVRKWCISNKRVFDSVSFGGILLFIICQNSGAKSFMFCPVEGDGQIILNLASFGIYLFSKSLLFLIWAKECLFSSFQWKHQKWLVVLWNWPWLRSNLDFFSFLCRWLSWKEMETCPHM